MHPPHTELFGVLPSFAGTWGEVYGIHTFDVDDDWLDEHGTFGVIVIQEPLGEGRFDSTVLAMHPDQYGLFRKKEKGDKKGLAIVGKGLTGAGKVIGKAVTGIGKGALKPFQAIGKALKKKEGKGKAKKGTKKSPLKPLKAIGKAVLQPFKAIGGVTKRGEKEPRQKRSKPTRRDRSRPSPKPRQRKSRRAEREPRRGARRTEREPRRGTRRAQREPQREAQRAQRETGQRSSKRARGIQDEPIFRTTMPDIAPFAVPQVTTSPVQPTMLSLPGLTIPHISAPTVGPASAVLPAAAPTALPVLPEPAVPSTRRERRLMKKQTRRERRGVGTGARLEKERLRQELKALKKTSFGLGAAEAMLDYRYGATTPSLAQAAGEINQWLQASQLPFQGQALTAKSLSPAYIFRFKMPIDHVLQQIGPGVLSIAARHGAPMTILSVHKAGPEAVIVVGAVETARKFFAQ